MAGLVALIAEAPEVGVSPTELEQLASSYRSLRPEPEHTRVSAGERGGAVLFGAPEDPSLGVERREESWAVHVGTAYVDKGSALEAGPAALDGQFSLVRYRTSARQLEVLSDPFGLQALYVAHRNGLAFFSTSALALARHLRARPNMRGLEVFLRTGPHFGELTNWEGIDRVAPATVYSYDPDGRASRVYWRPQIDPRVFGLSLEAAARECVDVAVDVFRRRFASHNGQGAWCDLSGGYDTRLAALLLDRAGVRFATNTNGTPDSADASIAKRVAVLGGWRWELGQLPDDWPEVCDQSYASALAWGDGILEATQLAEVLSLQRRRAHDGTVVFNGGGGEHWRDYAWKQEIPFGGRRKRVNFERWVAVRFMHPVDISVFRSDPTPRAREDLVERCRAHAAPYADGLNSVALDVLYAYKAMAHFGAYQSAARGTVRIELPFYAKYAFLTAFSVAPRYRNSHRLARVAIEGLNRQIAALPTTHGDLATPMHWRDALRFAPFFTTRARGAARKLTQNLPGPTLGALPERIPRRIEAARRRVLDAFAAQTELDPTKMRSGSLYDAAALRRLAVSGMATTTGWRTLGRIITVERALEAADAQID
jgi:hypothetical protein